MRRVVIQTLAQLVVGLLIVLATLTIAHAVAPSVSQHECLIPSASAGYDLHLANGVPQSAIHCVNLPRYATSQELDNPLYAGECYGRDTTYVACLKVGG